MELLYSLVESDLADADKAMTCLNIAILWDKQGRTEEALRWYGRGMGYELLGMGAGGHAEGALTSPPIRAIRGEGHPSGSWTIGT